MKAMRISADPTDPGYRPNLTADLVSSITVFLDGRLLSGRILVTVDETHGEVVVYKRKVQGVFDLDALDTETLYGDVKAFGSAKPIGLWVCGSCGWEASFNASKKHDLVCLFCGINGALSSEWLSVRFGMVPMWAEA